MGRQINFYFGADDEGSFLERIRDNLVLILKTNTTKPWNRVYNDFDNYEQLCTAYSETCICFENDLNHILYEKVPSREEYYIDTGSSPVIEYSRSGYRHSDNLILSGRIWYEHKYYGQNEEGESVLLEKPVELQRLYNSLARWIRKYCTRLPNGNYIGPHAMEIYERGAKLSP